MLDWYWDYMDQDQVLGSLAAMVFKLEQADILYAQITLFWLGLSHLCLLEHQVIYMS